MFLTFVTRVWQFFPFSKETNSWTHLALFESKTLQKQKEKQNKTKSSTFPSCSVFHPLFCKSKFFLVPTLSLVLHTSLQHKSEQPR